MADLAVLNESTLIEDSDIAPIVAALDDDFRRNGTLWGLDPVIVSQVPKGDPAPAGHWQLVFLDDSDQASALGYHELTQEGNPLGKVFVRTTQAYQQTVSRVASHEAWEMLVDPWLNRYTPESDGRSYCVEVGDLLSLDNQGRYGLGDVLLSGIALPAAYYPNEGTRYDLGGLITAPLPDIQPKDGAYLMWKGGAGWAYSSPVVTTAEDFLHLQAQAGSRRMRRIMGATQWRRSVPSGGALR